MRDGATEWNGVRNYTARNFLMTMQPGDRALFYHSNTEKGGGGSDGDHPRMAARRRGRQMRRASL
ncbi:MAG: EVE domain-containing protein [Sphingomonas sp.]